ncbi:hypothetical protein UAY_00904 [Enterococcus moraviensis ATCC BAA-383]|uniref:Uncharacterized protein n=1 Tax=Enterococcus moraviensis ATCC BAA-383 TaxID=1158609 RepID=R2TR52_9ENTE|nr:hypothetical protein UAY_00904 [Enterococcus moraviensis ATCC BAA-383]EOT73966.1 hypothetical protein I586_00962 [Enterococcus moraviensis ATCC BAA-383]OJG66120.1 hypothetical protein RV09_GL000969 [Enterococcus moraviensis]
MPGRKESIRNSYFIIFLIWLTGIILILNFLPIQDPDTLSLEEMIEL